MKIIKTSQVTDNNISKQSLKNKIYKVIGPYIKGFFTDESWESIRKIWDIFDEMGLNWAMTDSKYDGNVPPQNKTWKFEIDFINNKGKQDKIYGMVTAAGAGTVDDIFSRYDITVVMG